MNYNSEQQTPERSGPVRGLFVLTRSDPGQLATVLCQMKILKNFKLDMQIKLSYANGCCPSTHIKLNDWSSTSLQTCCKVPCLDTIVVVLWLRQVWPGLEATTPSALIHQSSVLNITNVSCSSPPSRWWTAIGIDSGRKSNQQRKFVCMWGFCNLIDWPVNKMFLD